MKRTLLVLTLSALLLLALGCSQFESPSGPTDSGTEVIQYLGNWCGDQTVVTLYAGQTIDVGTVTVQNDETNLEITFETTGDWYMTQTHLAISTSFSGIPQNKGGNPQVGKFPYKHDLDPPTQLDTYNFTLLELGGYEIGDTIYIAAHAVVEMEETLDFCIDFEGYTEKDVITAISTPSGDVNFYMVNALNLENLVVGDIGDLTPIVDSYPIIAEPLSQPPYADIVAFTTPYPGMTYGDDVVTNPNGTGAGGMVLTDPQDFSQSELMWHAGSQFQAIVFDVSGIADFSGISFVAIDLDHGENWMFQYYNASNELIYSELINESTMGLASGEGDGAALPFEFNDPALAKVVVWGGDNNGAAEIVGYAFDNICITTSQTQSETAWGNGNPFPGNNWSMWFTYVIQECAPPVNGMTPGDFRTQTQGGWGTSAAGNNPGSYRDANFEAAFPSGLTVGCSNFTAWFETTYDVMAVLPTGGTPMSLGQSWTFDTAGPDSDDLTGPPTDNTLLGQVVALTLSVGFDLYDPDFGASNINLKDLLVACSSCPCSGWTVQAVLDMGNKILGGCGEEGDPSASEINDCLSAINQNFVDGTHVNDYLALP